MPDRRERGRRCARALGRRSKRISSGTITSPPPTPRSALMRPAARPIRTRRTAASSSGGGAGDDLLRTVARGAPSRRRSCSTSTACSRRSSTARRTRASPTTPARRCEGSAGPLRPRRLRQRQGRRRREADRRARRARLRRRARARARPRRRPRGAGGCRRSPKASRGRVEDKGLSLSYHYRTAEDAEAAEQYLLEVAENARDAGLVPRFGRMVLEIRPPLETNKGSRRPVTASRRAGCGARSMPATTRPTSMRSARSRSSTSASGSGSSRTKARAGSARPPTSSCGLRPSCSSSYCSL